MLKSDASPELLALETYRKSQLNIRKLKESLPEHLVASLAQEVIRRLASRDGQLTHVPHAPTQEELERLCRALISDDENEAAEIIVGVRADGVPPEMVYLKYLAASARMLGEWWIEDRANFVEVTVGTGRLFGIMRGMHHLFEPTQLGPEKTAVFASVPGEDHTLGVRMAADLFRKDGWDIVLKVGLDHDDLVAEIESVPFCVAGLSIGGQHSIDALSRLVVALRICCPQTPLLLSGQNIGELRPLLSLMGPDAIARDIDEAREKMTALWERQYARINLAN